MSPRSYLAPAIFILASFTSASALADQFIDSFRISGFGSTSWTQSDNPTPLYVHREITDESCFDCDTTFGVQLDYYKENVNASMQLIKRPQDEWDEPELEWAYLAYNHDDITVRGGRLRLPLFLSSEYFYVAQVYEPVRLPQDVYNSVFAITGYNGVDLNLAYEFGEEATLNIRPLIGFQDENRIEMDGNHLGQSYEAHLNVNTNHLYGVNLQLNGVNYRVNATWFEANHGWDSDDTLPGFSAQDDLSLQMFSLGGEYNIDQIKLSLEGQINDHSSSWHTTVAYETRYDLTPYFVYSESYDFLAGDSLALGMRYNLSQNISLTGEWQHVQGEVGDDPHDGIGHFLGYPESHDANLYTLMLGFIF